MCIKFFILIGLNVYQYLINFFSFNFMKKSVGGKSVDVMGEVKRTHQAIQ